MEKEIRQQCYSMKKARFIKDDKYERKEYLRKGNTDLKTAKAILRTRLNMSNVPANYKNKGGGQCNLCDGGEGSTEHYLTSCSQIQLLRNIWKVQVNDIDNQEISKMKDVANYMEKVEILLEPGKRNY